MIIDLLKTFAAMPDRNGVLAAFDRTESPFAGYADLRAQIEAMPLPVPLPEVKDFIFGLTPENINTHIKNIQDVCMMVEFGMFDASGLFGARNRDMTFSFSVFIFQHNNSRNHDIIEQAFVSDALLLIVQKMLKYIEALDANTCAARRIMDNKVTILPIQPFQILNVDGWEVSFTKQANDFFF